MSFKILTEIDFGSLFPYSFLGRRTLFFSSLLCLFLCASKGFARTPDSSWPAPCDDQPSLESFNKNLHDTLEFNQMPALSRWYKVDEPRALALVVHGLNLNPLKMKAYALALNEMGISVLLTSLTGHRGSLKEQKDVLYQDWLDDMHTHYCALKKESLKLGNLPLYQLSFSLGTLTTLSYVAETKNHPFEKNIFIAPAAWIHWYSQIPQYLSFFSGRLGIPSGNLRSYRSQDTTSVAAYQAMADARKAVEKADPQLYQKDTLIFLDPEDELVSLKKLKSFKEESDLKSWNIVTVTNADHTLEKSFHHLIVDEPSLGKSEWKRVLSQIEKFFRVKKSEKDQ